MAHKHITGAAFVPNWSSISGALEGVARFFGLPHDTVEVMGLSGHAFWLDVAAGAGVLLDSRGQPESVDPARYRLLGLACEPTIGDRKRVHEAARRAIDRGSPAIAFGLFLPEFGLITGYDDRAGAFTVSTQLDEQGRGTLAYDRWPLAEHGPLTMVLSIKGRRKVDRAEARRSALGNAVGLTARAITAYETWAGAMASGSPVSAPGNAYTIQVTHTSRFRAAAFLERAGRELGIDLSEARAAHREAGLLLSRLGTLFPYPNGGDIGDEFLRGQAAKMLRAAAGHEARAAETIAEKLR